MYVFTLLKKSLNQEKIKWYHTISYILATIYAANQEQMVAVLCGVFTIYIIYLIVTKKVKNILNKTTVLLYILIIINLIVILVCPGNSARKIAETENWFPEYADYGFLTKIILGITSMMQYLIIDGRIIFMLLTAVMAYYIIKHYNKNTIIKIIGVIPFIGAIFYSVFGDFISNSLPYLANLMDMYNTKGLIINSNNYTTISTWIPMLIYVIILGSILINVFLIFGNNTKGRIVATIYLIGLATRLVLGFSPTVFASLERPFLFLYFSFIIMIILVFDKILDDNINVSNLVIFYVILSALSLLNNISI